MSSPVRLQSDAWSAVIWPEIGGALGSLRHEDVALLREITSEAVSARNVRLSACYPLVPYSNRIAHGIFSFDGVKHRLLKNFDNATNAIHGVGWQSAWSVEHADATSAVLALYHRPNGAEASRWPFAFDALQSFLLEPSGLSVTLCVSNAGDRGMPAGIGFHPYFVRSPGMTLAFEAEGVWLNGPDHLPQARSRSPQWDFRAARPVDERNLDNGFFGWKGSMRLNDASRGRAVTLRAGPLFRHLIVFIPLDRNFVAVEPVSHMTDAVNRTSEPDHGLVVLAPGERLCETVHFGVEPPCSP